ncbi:MAG: glutamate-cysteine ligase family protein [Myxococcota bacterium]
MQNSTLGLKDVLQAFKPQPQPNNRPRLGFEYEVFLFHRQGLKPLRWEGSNGLKATLAYAAQQTGGTPIATDPDKKFRLPSGAYLSVEPGGQFEYSSVPQETFGGCMRELQQFNEILQDVCDHMDFVPFYGGANPLHTVDEIGLVVQTTRYRLMDNYFARIGPAGRRMMRQTASLQLTFDYKTVEQGELLVRAASYLAPIVAGALSHSPFIDGQRSPYKSHRVSIWKDVDPFRCGPLPGFTAETYGFADYAEYVMKAPMFFIQKGSELTGVENLTFEDFNRFGHGGHFATFDDFTRHNSTIFNDVRLKGTVEVRTIDCQHPSLLLPIIAWLGGLLMSHKARQAVIVQLGHLRAESFEEITTDLGRQGLAAKIQGAPAVEILKELLDLSERFLPSSFSDADTARDYLSPLRAMVDQVITPADAVLEKFGDDPSHWVRSAADANVL